MTESDDKLLGEIILKLERIGVIERNGEERPGRNGLLQPVFVKVPEERLSVEARMYLAESALEQPPQPRQ